METIGKSSVIKTNVNNSGGNFSSSGYSIKNSSTIDFSKVSFKNVGNLKYNESVTASEDTFSSKFAQKLNDLKEDAIEFVSSVASIFGIDDLFDDVENTNGVIADSGASSTVSQVAIDAQETTTKTVNDVKQTAEKTASETKEAVDTKTTEIKENVEKTVSDVKSTTEEKTTKTSEETSDKSSSDNSNTKDSSSTEETKVETKSTSGGTAMDVPSGDTSYKSYTNYRSVTDTSTTNYALNNGLPMPYGKYKGQTFTVKTDDTGMRYVDKGDGKKYYTVAMGTYYGEVGDTLNVQTDDGNSFDVIICDAKGADTGTSHDGGTWYHTHGSSKDLVEFYIDSPDSIRVSGGTTGDYNYDSRFSGNITSITKYD